MKRLKEEEKKIRDDDRKKWESGFVLEGDWRKIKTNGNKGGEREREGEREGEREKTRRKERERERESERLKEWEWKS